MSLIVKDFSFDMTSSHQTTCIDLCYNENKIRKITVESILQMPTGELGEYVT